MRRRIPVAAIERVDVSGRAGRELIVVLTSALPGPATHCLVSRSAPAVHEFAEALRRALPVRDADEPRRDGAARVTVEPVERPGPEPRNVALGVLGVLYVLVAAALVARGAGERATVSWAVGVPSVLAPGVAAVVAGLRTLRDTVVLRARGIAVEGRLEFSYDVGTGEDAATHHVYPYVDARGERRERSGPEGGPSEVEIVYDPEDPDGTTTVGRATVGHLIGALSLALVLGLPMTLLGPSLVGPAMAALFD
ncbi:hypothetical protein ACFY1J_29345 [Streptomyces sp. NPDC001406]|uniref:hypothetical protein n=1 Tax=Streptomyces sp. NPDC001406 TaxID=3364572 RepID=UPI0036BF40BC